MISTPDRERAVELVKETVGAGARTFKVCEQMGISMRTYQRWTREGGVKADGRPGAVRPTQRHKLTQAEREGVGGVELVLHSDNGSAMKGASLMETLYRLGVMSSYSRPRVSNDNAYAESIFRTCKYRPDYPHKGFINPDAARVWVVNFVTWYNQEHKHSGLKFITPMQRHSGRTEDVMRQRQAVYKAAKAANPIRWSGSTRNWDLPEEVWLNPEKESSDLKAAA